MHPTTHYQTNKRVSKALSLPELLTAGVLGLVAFSGLGQQQASPVALSKKQLEDAYAQHDVKIRRAIPPYSAPPLLLDLSHTVPEAGMCDPSQHMAWENYFDGMMGTLLNVADKGVHGPSEVTATAFTITDTFGRIYSLPAKGSEVVIAKPIASRVCISRTRGYVYTRFTLDVIKDYRRTADKKDEGSPDAKITAAQFGGSVLFPSGFLETYLLNREGFIGVGKQYVLFMWKPVPSDDTFVISQAYLIESGVVFPVSTNGDAQTVYTNMPFREFEAKVKRAVAENVSVDVYPQARKRSH